MENPSSEKPKEIEEPEEAEEPKSILIGFLEAINPINVEEWPDMAWYAKIYEVFKVHITCYTYRPDIIIIVVVLNQYIIEIKHQRILYCT